MNDAELQRLAQSLPTAAELKRLAELLPTDTELKGLAESLPTADELKRLAAALELLPDTELELLPKYESFEPQALTEFPNVAELERLRTFLRLNWQETDKALQQLSSKNRTTENNE